MKYNANKAGLQYTTNVDEMADQAARGTTVEMGSKLTLAALLVRTSVVTYEKNSTGEGYGWKGVVKAAAIPAVKNAGVTITDISKATKVIHSLVPDLEICDDNEVVGIVTAFTLKYGSLTAAYNELNGNGKGTESSEGDKAWNMQDAINTLVNKAYKESVDPITLRLAVEQAITAKWNNDSESAQAA